MGSSYEHYYPMDDYYIEFAAITVCHCCDGDRIVDIEVVVVAAIFPADMPD